MGGKYSKFSKLKEEDKKIKAKKTADTLTSPGQDVQPKGDSSSGPPKGDGASGPSKVVLSKAEVDEVVDDSLERWDPENMRAKLSKEELMVFTFTNLARMKPKAFAQLMVEYYVEHPWDKSEMGYQIAPHTTMQTHEGKKLVDDTIAWLRHPDTVPLNGLTLSPGLCSSATIVSGTPFRGHMVPPKYTKKPDLWAIISKQNPSIQSMGENLAYTSSLAGFTMVMDLIVDDGVAGRGHRHSIMNPEFTHIGVSLGNVVMADEVSQANKWKKGVQHFGTFRGRGFDPDQPLIPTMLAELVGYTPSLIDGRTLSWVFGMMIDAGVLRAADLPSGLPRLASNPAFPLGAYNRLLKAAQALPAPSKKVALTVSQRGTTQLPVDKETINKIVHAFLNDPTVEGSIPAGTGEPQANKIENCPEENPIPTQTV